MKLVKMSLAAAVLLGASAFALENVKVDGDARLYYGTNNMDAAIGAGNPGASGSLFAKGNSFADTALRLGVTGDLMKNISFGVTGYAISTLGLENNLVSNTWTGAHTPDFTPANSTSLGAQVNDHAWIAEMWIAATYGKTTAKLGRMELDTPLAFSEKWSIVPNTFEAAVLINQDVPDTTLVGAWVGKGNGVNSLSQAGLANDNGAGVTLGAAPTILGIDGVVGLGANFNTFGLDGAYAAAAVNNSWKPLVAQAWYYNVVNVADAVWLQADWDCQLVKGAKLGAQYANIAPKGAVENVLNTLGANHDSSAYAFKLAYAGVENLNLSAAYSQTDKDGVFKIANVATSNLNAAQSKLYTEAYWNYGYVGAPGSESYNITAEYNMKDVANFGLYVTNATVKPTGLSRTDMNEVAVAASKKIAALDATLAYVSTDTGGTTGAILNDGKRFDTILAMLKLNF